MGASMKNPEKRSFPEIDFIINQYEIAFDLENQDLPSRWEHIKQDMRTHWQRYSSFYKERSDWQDRALIRSYLECDDSLGLHNNCQIYFDLECKQMSQLDRAASLCASLCSLYHNFDDLEACSERGIQFDMTILKRLFASERLPCLSHDKHYSDKHSTHFIVMYKGNFFKLPLSTSKCDIRNNLYNLQESTSQSFHLGLGTILGRKLWSVWKERIRDAHPNNDHNFELISSALFILCLDDQKSESLDDTVRLIRDDSYHNRYFDKALQIIVLENAFAAVSFEHSFVDGHHVNRLVKEIEKGLCCDKTSQSSHLCYEHLSWKNIPFDFNVLTLQQECLATASMKHSFVIRSKFDVERIRRHQLNPDAIIQLVCQSVGLIVSSRFLASSEAVSMRHTFMGRYETVNTLTPEAKSFLLAWHESSYVSDRSLLWKLLHIASEAHRNLIISCKKGQVGLLGPRSFLESFLQHSDWNLSQLQGYLYPTIATSNAFSDGTSLASMNDSGDRIGIAYGYQDHQLTMTVKLQGTWIAFKDNFRQNLLEEISNFQNFIFAN